MAEETKPKKQYKTEGTYCQNRRRVWHNRKSIYAKFVPQEAVFESKAEVRQFNELMNEFIDDDTGEGNRTLIARATFHLIKSTRADSAAKAAKTTDAKHKWNEEARAETKLAYTLLEAAGLTASSVSKTEVKTTGSKPDVLKQIFGKELNVAS